MLPRSHTHCIRVSFADHRLVANAGPILPSALAGGDCIDDVDVLRTGGTACALGCTLKAPSTLEIWPETGYNWPVGILGFNKRSVG